MVGALEIIETVWDNLWENWSQTVEEFLYDQDQTFLRIAQIGSVSWQIAISAIALYILGASERLGQLLLKLFQDIPQAVLESVLELILAEIPSKWQHQVLRRSDAVSDAIKGIVVGGQNVANLNFPLGAKVTRVILKVKKILDLAASRSAQNIYMKLIPNAPLKFFFALVQVFTAIWKGVATAAFLGLLYVVVRMIVLEEIFFPLRQNKERKRIKLTSYARIPASP